MLTPSGVIGPGVSVGGGGLLRVDRRFRLEGSGLKPAFGPVFLLIFFFGGIVVLFLVIER
jgi:hypothetical protein